MRQLFAYTVGVDLNYLKVPASRINKLVVGNYIEPKTLLKAIALSVDHSGGHDAHVPAIFCSGNWAPRGAHDAIVAASNARRFLQL